MMKSVKTHHQDEEEDEYEEFGSKRDAQPSSNANREGKNNDKATATRSKHSVTEQRRRSKINERFQILRDLIPNSDQKRDTASFLLEVIEYVQYLQEKVQKHEGSYQGWSTEPTKLMPWRNSHWRVQSSVGHPQAVKIDSGTAPTFPHHFDDNNMMGSIMHTNPQDHVESGPTQDPSCKLMDQQPDPIKNPTVVPAPSPIITGTPVQLDGTAFSGSLQRPLSNAQHHSADSHVCTNALNQNEDLTVEGGTISISSVYSQGLLNTLTEALQNAGVDLSQATISVQVDLGKRANRGLTANKDSEIPYSSNNHHVEHFQDGNSGEDNEQVHKRMKI